jgi:hypothetical protein
VVVKLGTVVSVLDTVVILLYAVVAELNAVVVVLEVVVVVLDVVVVVLDAVAVVLDAVVIVLDVIFPVAAVVVVAPLAATSDVATMSVTDIGSVAVLALAVEAMSGPFSFGIDDDVVHTVSSADPLVVGVTVEDWVVEELVGFTLVAGVVDEEASENVSVANKVATLADSSSSFALALASVVKVSVTV